MFTIEQIKAAHAKVKSGADFPGYIQEMKSLGIRSYEHFVADGHIQYYGDKKFSIAAKAKWAAMEVAAIGSVKKLQHSLAIHQQGKTSYPVFCQESASAGVKKWVVDTTKMTCIYYDRAGNQMLAETIPTP
jgi:uncharacterized protein YbcV (DUF1398 family)